MIINYLQRYFTNNLKKYYYYVIIYQYIIKDINIFVFFI